MRRKADSYFRNKKFEEAKKEWNEVLSLFPKNRLAIQESLRCDKEINPEVFRQVAQNILREGKNLLAAKFFRRAQKKFMIIKEIDPNFPGIDSLLAQTKSEEKTTQKAKLPKNTLDNYYRQALLLYRQGKLKDASAWFQKVVDNDPMNFQAIASLSKIRKLLALETPDTTKRTQYLSDAQLLRAKKLYIQGLAQYSNNNYQKAIESWQRVLAIDPNHMEAKSNIRRVQKLLKS
jgi:tetratricopeptide (TPR) repeat protein